MGGVPVSPGILPDKAIDIGDGNTDLDLAVLSRFAVLDLVEVPGIGIIDGRPEQCPEIARLPPAIARVVSGHCLNLTQDRVRKPGGEAILLHGLVRDGSQVNRALVFHGSVRVVCFRVYIASGFMGGLQPLPSLDLRMAPAITHNGSRWVCCRQSE
ncbi:hypothetical protein ASZ90_016346 [hydrocarbon metagenome]|uniref:Uncharacterized protein n=1 Tax=hydrocarbon metagenome TaxID=938273 RepID=A0A0W8EYI6_9ZZZZ